MIYSNGRKHQAAVLDEWEYEGELFGTTLCAVPGVATVFSVTHLATGLAACKSLTTATGGREAFNKLVAYRGRSAMLVAIERGYRQMQIEQPGWFHYIGPGVHVYDARPFRPVVEVWVGGATLGAQQLACGTVAGRFADLSTATKLANVLNSLRNPPQLGSGTGHCPLPKL